ncbi:MAG: threonine ammonia-lyase, biosynthetic [Alphaproteobacteria bacterium]|nr:threonine ammonia-lyase, biosynthetic [Alphaproteobacteria bacterium]
MFNVSSSLVEEYAKKVAAVEFHGIVQRTALQKAAMLSASLGRDVLLKREDQQPVFSFKVRGAANKIGSLNMAQKKAGVITASAGNHAQGVALAAKRFQIRATIVMPRTTPEIKVNAVRAQGAEVVLFGDSFPEALQHALELQAKESMTFIHPYDDDEVIAGQGTIGKEILEDASYPIDAVFVPVGGGGLAAGVTAWIKHVRPHVKVFGVEPVGSDCLTQALVAGSRVKLPKVELFADGVAVAQVGEKPFKILREVLDGTILVSVDEICAAAWDVSGDTRTVPEPSGALAIAGLKKYLEGEGADGSGALVAIVSGANVDSDRVRYMAERISVGQKREILMSVTLPERPGAYREFCRLLNGHAITEFNYRYSSGDMAYVFVGLRVQNYAKDSGPILSRLRDNGFPVTDLTDNEVAKEHIRHMVGGRPPCPLKEVVYSFEFPEHPGALLAFLEKIQPSWNISLFHYRSHGASHGRVLMGLQVPHAERAQLRALLEGEEFNGRDETENPAYAQFLRETETLEEERERHVW